MFFKSKKKNFARLERVVYFHTTVFLDTGEPRESTLEYPYTEARQKATDWDDFLELTEGWAKAWVLETIQSGIEIDQGLNGTLFRPPHRIDHIRLSRPLMGEIWI